MDNKLLQSWVKTTDRRDLLCDFSESVWGNFEAAENTSIFATEVFNPIYNFCWWGSYFIMCLQNHFLDSSLCAFSWILLFSLSSVNPLDPKYLDRQSQSFFCSPYNDHLPNGTTWSWSIFGGCLYLPLPVRPTPLPILIIYYYSQQSTTAICRAMLHRLTLIHLWFSNLTFK